MKALTLYPNIAAVATKLARECGEGEGDDDGTCGAAATPLMVGSAVDGDTEAAGDAARVGDAGTSGGSRRSSGSKG